MTKVNRRFMDAMRVVRCLGAVDFSVLKWMGQASSLTVQTDGDELELAFRNASPKEETIYYCRRIADVLNGSQLWNTYPLWNHRTHLGVAAAIVNHFLVDFAEVAMLEDRA